MSGDNSTEPSNVELQERVRRLEAYLFESRRDVLKGAVVGGTALGTLGLGAGAAAAQASTTDGDGDIGTPSNRVDVFADGANVDTQLTFPVSVGVNEQASRDSGTWYQNTNNVPIFINVSWQADAGDNNLRMLGHRNGSQSDNVVDRSTAVSTTNDIAYNSISYPVAVGDYYKVQLVGDTGAATQREWTEARIGEDI